MLVQIAINSAKFSTWLIRALRLGSGSALPGRVALKLCPGILQYFNSQVQNFNYQSLITGTNGKTTCTGLLKQIYIEIGSETKQSVICNDLGANLSYGIVAEFVNSADMHGRLSAQSYALEIDEAALVEFSKIFTAQTITVTNLYRDQLDRFGEIDSTQKLIMNGIQNLLRQKSSSKLTIVLNADDAKVAEIQELLERDVATFNRDREYLFYKVKYSGPSIENFDSEIKSNRIGSKDFVVEVLEEGIGYSLIKLVDPLGDSVELKLALPGLYNVYNAAAAAATAYAYGISLENIKTGLENYRGVFGRAEKKSIDGKEYQTFLIKNPTGCTEVLKYLSQDHKAKYLIAINDNYADGRDVSWLWDAKFEYISSLDNKIYCSGQRALDMATRLKYAGFCSENIVVNNDLASALKEALNNAGEDEHLYVLPTYTALLELNKIT